MGTQRNVLLSNHWQSVAELFVLAGVNKLLSKQTNNNLCSFTVNSTYVHFIELLYNSDTAL